MNKQLKFTVKFDVNSGSLKRVQRSIETITSSADKLGGRFGNFERSVNKSNSNLDKMKLRLKESNVLVSKLVSGFRKIAATYFGKMGLDALIETADLLTSAQNKLNYINAQNLGAAGVTQMGGREMYSDATLNATSAGMEKIFNAAQQTRMSYTDMAENVGKSLTLAGDAFDHDMDKAIRFQKIMSEAYTVGGASAQQKSSSMYQLIQALGSGRLQGDELRSVAEGAQMAYHQIEQYAQALYGTTDSIKEMGSKGMLTSKVVVDAIMSAEDEMDSAFDKTLMTFEQAKTKITNEAIRAFQPLMKKVTDWLNSDKGQKAIEIIVNCLYKLANVLDHVLDIVIRVFNYAIDHANTTRKVLGAISGLLAAGMIPNLIRIMKILGKITGVTNILKGAGTLLGGASGALGSVAAAAGAVLSAIAPIGILLGAIVAVCWIFSDSVEDFLGRLCGTFYAIGQAIIDVFAVVGDIFAGLITAGADLVAWFVQFVVDTFHNGVTLVENAFLGLLNVASNILLKIANGLNAIGFGIDTKSLEAFEKKVSKPKEYQFNAKLDFSNVDAATQTFKVHDPDEIYKKGYKKGYNILGSGKDSTSVLDTTLGTLDEYMSNALGGTDSDYEDPTAKAIKETADNTGDIAGQLAATTEDLTYLRKIAELEWKRDYTNYNIEIAMTNNNTITKEADVDQITHALNAKLSEVAGSSASGLHF